MNKDDFKEVMHIIACSDESEKYYEELNNVNKRGKIVKTGIICTAAIIAIAAAALIIVKFSGPSKTGPANGKGENVLISTSTKDPLNNQADPTQTTTDISSFIHYDLIHFNNKDYRIVLKAKNQFSGNIDPDEQEESDLEFGSVDQLIQTIAEDKFETWQLEVIRDSFKSDEQGVIIFDLNNPKYAKMPEGFSIDGVYWRGADYSFSLQNAQNELAYIHWLTDEEFGSQFDNSYTIFFEKDTVEIVSHVQNNGFDEFVFKTSVATLKKVRYKIDDNTWVDETYRLESSVSSVETSDSVPYKITIYHQESGSNYIVDLFHPVTRYESDYLLQFGLLNEKNSKIN